jgi:tripartite-type tricarboxylate transporter receptor subunit TctC
MYVKVNKVIKMITLSPEGSTMHAYRLALLAGLVALATSPALAGNPKDCGTTNVQGPPNGGFTQTETQTAACNSNSNTGEQIVVKNKGGGTPPGQQPD